MEQRACAEPEQLAQEIAALTSLSVKELKGCWRSLYGSEPHRRMRRELLTRTVTYRLQERTRRLEAVLVPNARA